jgi:hypothetical protein
MFDWPLGRLHKAKYGGPQGLSHNTAAALAWTDAELFGCDDIRPYTRIDRMGSRGS